jgi:glycosyltransferase involved in cell wall biosynthesis
MLLRTWKSLSDERKDCHLVLVGGGGGQFLSCEIELRAFVLLKSLQDRVTFTGFQTDVHKYLQAADFFVFPSENEALSIALLEALSCELPCLASDISGNRDIVEDRRNGRLLPVNDETAWLNGMREFLGNPAQAIPLGKQGRATVLEQFSIARVAEQHLDLFRSLTSPSGGKAS